MYELQILLGKEQQMCKAAYSNIGINRIEEMLRDPRCQFVLYVGNKKLVKREMFEEYLKNTLEL
jgi:hypothetical protein